MTAPLPEQHKQMPKAPDTPKNLKLHEPSPGRRQHSQQPLRESSSSANDRWIGLIVYKPDQVPARASCAPPAEVVWPYLIPRTGIPVPNLTAL